MGHQRAYRVAVDGKHPVCKKSQVSNLFAHTRRLTVAAAAFLGVALSASASHGQANAFAGMAYEQAAILAPAAGNSSAIRAVSTIGHIEHHDATPPCTRNLLAGVHGDSGVCAR